MRCPVCRAENAEETACRRCRADLALLVTLEQSRRQALWQAMRAARAGDGAATTRHARTAHRLRPDPESWRWVAIGALLRRDFARALACHQRHRLEANQL